MESNLKPLAKMMKFTLELQGLIRKNSGSQVNLLKQTKTPYILLMIHTEDN